MKLAKINKVLVQRDKRITDGSSGKQYSFFGILPDPRYAPRHN
jgi:hypothetical protein